MIVLLPIAVLHRLSLAALLLQRPLSAWHQALIAGITLLICAYASQAIQFIVPGLSSAFSWKSLPDFTLPPAAAIAMLLPALRRWLLATRIAPRAAPASPPFSPPLPSPP